jgi:hypothetical protein
MPEAPVAPAPVAPPQLFLPGPKVLLMGGAGSGKTYSLRTLLEAELKVAAVFIDPGMEAVIDLRCQDGFHWRYVPPFAPDWTTMLRNAEMLNKLSNDALQGYSDPDRSKYKEWFSFITAMSAFECERCKLKLGALDKLGNDWAVVNDGLSGITWMSRNLGVGGKPMLSQPDYGKCMDNIEKYMQMFTSSFRSLGVMIAHLEREKDEVSGGMAITVSTLGAKLGPKIPRMFSDVIHAKRDGDKFTWNVNTFNMELKTRNLPIADNQPPSFVPLLRSWRAKQEKGIAA